MVNAINNKGVKIYIGDADAVGSGLSTDYQAYITSADESGGERSFDSLQTFGGNIPNNGPPDAYEVSFDVIIALDANATVWRGFLQNQTSHVLAMQGGSAAKGGFFWTAWNNAVCTSWNKTFEADGVWEGTITFSLTPSDEDGNTNVVERFNAAEEITDASGGLVAADWGN